MAPAASKRKRPDRQASEDDGASRPSPYKPEKSRAARRTSRGKASDESIAEEESAREQDASGTPQAATLSSRNGTQTSALAPETAPEALETSGNGDTTHARLDTSSATPRQPYHYAYVTEDIVSSWSDSGMQSLLSSASALNEIELSDLFAELIRSCLDGRLTPQQAGLVVRDVVAAQRDGDLDMGSLFLDTVQFLYDAAYKGPVLRPLLAASGVDQQTMREQLDHALLIDVGLVRSTFDRMRTRKTTNLLYRQANFNLLREESEGYSKLITEYFNTAQEASNRRDEAPYMAEDAFQRVKALVGAFDLDVGRVLDITMDVGANLLVKAYPFFMKFYRASSWWPANETLDGIKWDDQGFSSLPSWALPSSGRWVSSDEERSHSTQLREIRDRRFWDGVGQTGIQAFFDIGARKILDFDSILPLLEAEVPLEIDSRGKEVNRDKRLRINQDKEYMRKTGTLPPSGNHDAAQLLGFKLRFYASDARDANDILPDNLIFFTALLIKIGFISLRDIYPHLYPTDEGMGAEQARLRSEKTTREKQDRPGGGMNALLNAAPLLDSEFPSASMQRRSEKEKSGAGTPAPGEKDESKEKKDESKEPPKPMNQKLLLVKALLLIGALPEALFIIGRFPWLAELDPHIPGYLQRLARQMLSNVSESLNPLGNRDSLRESKGQMSDTTARADGTLNFTPRPAKRATRWMWSDVSDDDSGFDYRHYYVDWNDNIPVCQTEDDVFLLCNTFMGYLGAQLGQDVAVYGTLLRLAKRSLNDNPSRETFAQWLELTTRLLVPASSWTKHNPELAQQLFDVLSFFPTATRYNIYFDWFKGRLTRRADVAPALARNKFEVRDVLRRISNDFVKKQSRALAKVAISSPGVVMIEMIEQLESYSNMIPSLVECTRYFGPLAWDILSWALINSLSGQGRDRMQADGMLTSSWLQALAQFVASLYTRHLNVSVAPILQYLASELRVGNSTDLEVLEQLLAEMAGIRSDTDFNDAQVMAMAGGPTLRTHILSQLSDTRQSKQKSAGRLMEALRRPELTGQVLVAIAQERQMYSSHAASKAMPLKVLGNNTDKIQAVFHQYLEVLKANMEPKDFERVVPDAVSLAKDYGLEPAVAFMICRTAIRGRMEEFDDAKKQELEDIKKDSANHIESGPSGALDTVMKDAKSGTETGDGGQDIEAALDPENVAASPWHSVLEPIIQSLSQALPDLASRTSIPFYVTFWTLDLYDVFVPMDSYTSTVKRLDSQITEITNDRADMSALASKARDAKKKGLIALRDKLRQEPTQHLSDYLLVRNRISRKERFHYFPKSSAKDLQEFKGENDAKHQALLQECFLPRAMLSSLDAQFSFQVLKMLHDNGTPGFSLMHLILQLFKKQELTALIFQCTLNEAQHLGRFLNELLRYLHSWHADKTTYEKEALGNKTKLPGFVKVFDENGDPKAVMDYEVFRRMLYNCHAYLNGALQACFESGEYMHIRNGIIILKAIHQAFPALKFIGKNMVDHVTKLSQQDPRQDLKLAAMSLLGPLKSREKHWLLPQAFRLNDLSKDVQKSSSRAPSAHTETPQPASDAKLNAAAPEFKPNLNGTRKESVAGGTEDGEIQDEKTKGGDAEAKDAPSKEPVMSTKQHQIPSQIESRPPREATRSDSKPSTPARAPPNGPQRSESSRLVPTQPGSSRRPNHDLPTRLEPPKALPTSANRPAGRYPLRPEDQYGRLDRPDTRPASREQSPGSRSRPRTPPIGATRGYRDDRSFDRPGDRPLHDSRGPRDDLYLSSRREGSQLPGRYGSDVRDRPQPVSRVSEVHLHPDRQNRMESVAVPTESQPSSRLPPTTAAPPPSQQEGSGPPINPARLALIGAAPNDLAPPKRGREPEPRRDRDSRPDDREQQDFPQSHSRRQSARGPDPPSRSEQTSDFAPTGPKKGRLTQADMTQGESNYGRLNGPAEPPAGPRQQNGPSGRGGRNFTGPINTRASEQAAPPSVGTRLLESPAGFRAPMHQPSGSGSQVERISAPVSAPSTPVNEPQVHPSRAAQLNQPPTIQTSFPAPNGPRHASSPTTGPPSGPRQPGRGGPLSNTPTGPSPSNGMPPSGPASATERQRRQERQRNSINATLQGATNGASPGGQGLNFRGAASQRQPSGSHPSTLPKSNVSPMTSSMEPPQGRPETRPPFEDPSASHPGRPDLFQADRSDGGGRRREDNRPERQRESRDPSREPRLDHNDQASRGPQPPPPNRPEDGRDRRGLRNDRPQREDGPPRDLQQPRDMRRGPDRQPFGPPADMTSGFSGPPPVNDWNRGNDTRGSRRDGPDEGRRGGRGGGAAGRHEDFRGPRREDERRELGARPPPDDGGMPDAARKRRHEEGQFDATKRRRSGR